jgi:hypothetical protein
VPAPAPGQAPDCGSLALAERAARLLPPTPGVSGAASDPASGDLLLWTADQTVIPVTEAGTGRPLPLGRDVTITAVGPGPDAPGFTVLDGSAGVLLRLDPEGHVVAREVLPRIEGEVVEAAVFAGGRWVVGSRDVLRRRYVLRRLESGGTTVLFATEPVASLSGIPRFHLTAAGSAVLLAEVMAPFRVHRVPLEAGAAQSYEPVLTAGREGLIPDSALAVWRSLAALPLDCGAVQTLTDLSSLARLLVRYDQAGRVARVTRIEAPLGLMVSRPERHALIGARRAGAETLELVFYEWRWVREHHDSLSPSSEASIQ